MDFLNFLRTFYGNLKNVRTVLIMLASLAAITFVIALMLVPSSTIPASLPSESATPADMINSTFRIVTTLTTLIVLYRIVFSGFAGFSEVDHRMLMHFNPGLILAIEISVVAMIVALAFAILALVLYARKLRA